MSIGEQILNEIIMTRLVHAEMEGLCVWEANSPEVLEAIVLKFAPKIMREIKTASE